uniref:Uncharacterized protein n=1 Tax=Rhizophora mucronata TaxID=61149 RepID=A0A2P2PWQ2_RHIMU
MFYHFCWNNECANIGYICNFS